MLKYSSSLMAAKAVLDCLGLISDKNFNIEAYQNGREQGYIVIDEDSNLDKIAYVARHRSSDEIVVYIGEYESQGLNDGAYLNGKYFDPFDFKKAAKYIDEQIGQKKED